MLLTCSGIRNVGFCQLFITVLNSSVNSPVSNNKFVKVVIYNTNKWKWYIFLFSNINMYNKEMTVILLLSNSDFNYHYRRRHRHRHQHQLLLLNAQRYNTDTIILQNYHCYDHLHRHHPVMSWTQCWAVYDCSSELGLSVWCYIQSCHGNRQQHPQPAQTDLYNWSCLNLCWYSTTDLNTNVSLHSNTPVKMHIKMLHYIIWGET